MLMEPECLLCLYNQTLRAANILDLPKDEKFKVMQNSAKVLSSINVKQTPPEAAAILYPSIAKILNKDDIYKDVKKLSRKRAKEILKRVPQKDNLEDILKIGVIGNVMDFATEVMFDIDKEVENIFTTSFEINDIALFEKELKNAKELLIIGDNAGEDIFDAKMATLIKNKFTNLTIYYFTRGKPIINDITYNEAIEDGLDKEMIVIDSGVDTPGFIYDRANNEAKEVYNRVDLILAKGMGNFETMEGIDDNRLFFLFKVKCQVVSKRVGAKVGSIVFKKNQKV
ncbi:MAG: DUF89 family protein [Epsilonproteobacteria bacterium]|nr:DUF89 family protein [Campylobacterota bacterium]